MSKLKHPFDILFDSYLTNRKQYIDTKSDMLDITMSVQQGSILAFQFL